MKADDREPWCDLQSLAEALAETSNSWRLRYGFNGPQTSRLAAIAAHDHPRPVVERLVAAAADDPKVQARVLRWLVTTDITLSMAARADIRAWANDIDPPEPKPDCTPGTVIERMPYGQLFRRQGDMPFPWYWCEGNTAEVFSDAEVATWRRVPRDEAIRRLFGDPPAESTDLDSQRDAP